MLSDRALRNIMGLLFVAVLMFSFFIFKNHRKQEAEKERLDKIIEVRKIIRERELSQGIYREKRVYRDMTGFRKY